MKHFIAAAAVSLAATVATVAAQACTPGTAQNISGNWYCQAVNAISYTNFGTPGTYNKVVDMANGCQFAAQSYGGGISPLDEEVLSPAHPQMNSIPHSQGEHKARAENSRLTKRQTERVGKK